MIPKDAILIKNKKNNFILFDLKSYTEDCISDSKVNELQDDYQIECPYCVDAYKTNSNYDGPYLKRKLYVYKDFSVGHCFRCNQVFINATDELNFDINYFESELNMADFNLVKLDGPIWNLDLFKEFNDYDEQGYNYLINNRHYYFKTLYKSLGIKFSNHNPVIPFYFKGELIYYQIKMAFGNNKLPYFSPPITHKPAYIIEHGLNKNFVISEGTFDGIADLILYPDRTPFCLLGSSITDYQITMLRTYVPEDILVYMDNTELSMKVADKLNRYINYANISIRPSDGQDPEEYLKYKILRKTEIL